MSYYCNDVMSMSVMVAFAPCFAFARRGGRKDSQKSVILSKRKKFISVLAVISISL